MSLPQRLARLILLAVALGGVACSGASNPAAPAAPSNPAAPSPSIPVVPPAGMFPGDSSPAIAVGLQPGAASTSWVSSDPGVATITSGGVVTAVATGTTRLTVTDQGRSGSAVLTVYGDADLVGVTIQCPGTLVVGQTTSCRAFASVRNGASIDVAFKAAWSSTSPLVARVDAGGFVVARSNGQAQLSAAYRGQTGVFDVSVSGGEQDLLRISANAQQGPFRPGSEVQLWLQGFYSVVSGTAGRLTLEVSDQDYVIAATTITVPRGGDSFLLTARFTVPSTSTRVCPVAVLRVGAVTVAAPDNRLQYCIAVSP